MTDKKRNKKLSTYLFFTDIFVDKKTLYFCIKVRRLFIMV